VAVLARNGTGGTSGGALLGTGGDPSTSPTADATGAADPGGSSDAAGSLQGTDEQRAQQQAVVDYYALLPGQLDQGWQRLTPDYQQSTAGGFDSYSRFWSQMSAVTVRSVSPAGSNSVDATVSYTYRDGREVQERTVFRMAPQDGGGWAIDGSTVQSSR
jgi:eukaryotic-like serine/threonine-protein kinase